MVRRQAALAGVVGEPALAAAWLGAVTALPDSAPKLIAETLRSAIS
jgi:hypothetical protein